MSRAGSARSVPSRSLLIRDIQVLATFGDELGDIADAAVYVEGNIIKWVGASADIPKDISADETITLPNRVLIPGMVNTHHHMFQCLTRCVAQVCKAPTSVLTELDKSHIDASFHIDRCVCAGRETFHLAGNLLWSMATYDSMLPISLFNDVHTMCELCGAKGSQWGGRCCRAKTSISAVSWQWWS